MPLCIWNFLKSYQRLRECIVAAFREFNGQKYGMARHTVKLVSGNLEASLSICFRLVRIPDMEFYGASYCDSIVGMP